MDGPDAVIFDLDGIIVESERIWDAARRDLVARTGGVWREEATRAMMGMSSLEWTRYLRDELQVPLSVEEIGAAVVAEMERRYRERLPLIPGAVEAVRGLAAHWRLGLASSANRPIIDLVLAEAGIADCFEATVSSEEVGNGKPAPDVYLEAARRLAVDPGRCVAIEDSTNGIRAAVAAGMATIAVPNAELPPAEDALRLAAASVDDVSALDPELIRRVAAGTG